MNTSQEDLHAMRSSYFPTRSEYFTSDLDATRRCKKRGRTAWRKTMQCEDTLHGTKQLEEPPSMGSRRIASHVVLTRVELSTFQRISTRHEETTSHSKVSTSQGISTLCKVSISQREVNTSQVTSPRHDMRFHSPSDRDVTHCALEAMRMVVYIFLLTHDER